MKIEKAYLFARQISAGGAPPIPINVYFENGVFNPSLVPSGFDFNNNEVIYSYSDDWGRLVWDGEYHADAVNGSIARLKADPDVARVEKWILTNNSLQFNHTIDSDPYSYDRLGEVLFLPVVGWRPAYDYTCIEYNLTTADGGIVSESPLYINTYSYDDWVIEEGFYCYDICYGKQIENPTSFSTMSIRSINEESRPVQSIDMIEIAGTPYSNGKSFTVNITKIYGTNTPPN